jgi:hypothetical protein
MKYETITLDEAFKQIDARRRLENPWTPEDEARMSAKSKRERAAQEAWALLHPEDESESEDEDETD